MHEFLEEATLKFVREYKEVTLVFLVCFKNLLSSSNFLCMVGEKIGKVCHFEAKEGETISCVLLMVQEEAILKVYMMGTSFNGNIRL